MKGAPYFFSRRFNYFLDDKYHKSIGKINLVALPWYVYAVMAAWRKAFSDLTDSMNCQKATPITRGRG